MNRREKDAHEDLCRRLVTALNERDAARAEVARLRGAVEGVPDWLLANGMVPQDVGFVRANLRAALAAPTADDGAERGAR